MPLLSRCFDILYIATIVIFLVHDASLSLTVYRRIRHRKKRSNHSVNIVCQNLRQIESRTERKCFKHSALLKFNWSSEQAQNLNMRLQELISTELPFKIKTP